MISVPCECVKHASKPFVDLNFDILDTWTQNDHKDCFLLVGKEFHERMNRLPLLIDWKVIIDYIKSKKFKNIEITYIDLPEQIDFTFNDLQFVSLISVSLPPSALQSILRNNLKIKYLRLTGNKLSDGDVFCIREFMLKNKVLEYLDVGYCDLNHARFAMIADGVINCPSLNALNMSRLVTPIDCSKISSLIAIIINQSNLSELHFKHCHLDCHDMIPICEYLVRRSSKVRYLDLGSNRVGPYGIEMLFKALKGTEMCGLDVSNNKAGADGGEWIAHYLPHTKIRYLDIGRNGIPSTIIEFILNTIIKVHPMRILNLVGNEFDYNVGALLKRSIDGGVLNLGSLDVDVTYDRDYDGFRVVPQANRMAQYNQRYHRVTPFYRKYDITKNQCNFIANNFDRLLIDTNFIDPVIVDRSGRVLKINQNGELIRD